MNEYLLSIIIPTRNREKYCIESIKQILDVIDSNSEVQIVVQDNSDTDKIGIFIEGLSKSNILYKKIQVIYHS